MFLSISDKARTLKDRTLGRTRRGNQRRTDQEYQYDTLPTQGNYFRTLILLPGAGDEPLRCTLQTTLLGSNPFEAISYVWGSDTKDREIKCGNHSIPITSNLWTVLRHVRSNCPRVLWADSVCIDQADLEEKSRQVAMMGDIYRLADCVLIFLGAQDSGHGAQVSSLLEDMEELIRDGLEYAGATANAFPWPHDDAPILKDSRWTSFSYMLRQSWFKRGWVVQEVAVSSKSVLLWGQYRLSWDHAIQTYHWIHRRALVLRKTVQPKIDVHDALYRQKHPTFANAFGKHEVRYSMLRILYKAYRLQFSDRRDKIFAFTAVAQDLEDHSLVQPNYDLSFFDVCRRFAIDHIFSTKNPELLEYVCHDKQPLCSDLPSWVPHWSNTRGHSLAPKRKANWRTFTSRTLTPCEPIVTYDSILRVRGVIMDEVVWTSRELWRETTTLEEIQNIWEALTRLNLDHPYPAADLVIAFLETIMMSIPPGERKKYFLDRAACAVLLLEKTSHMIQDTPARWRQQADGGSDINQLVNHVRNITDSTKFIVTRRGYMGLAPPFTKEQDCCAIIFGCTTSSILRNTDQEAQYQYLGSATLTSCQPWSGHNGNFSFPLLGDDRGKDWVNWDVEEQDIELC